MMPGDRVTQRDLYEALSDFRQEAREDRQEILKRVDQVDSKVDKVDGRLQALEDWRLVDASRKRDLLGIIKTGPGVIVSIIVIANTVATAALIWLRV